MNEAESALAVERYAEHLHHQHYHGPNTGLSGLIEPRWIDLDPAIRGEWRARALNLLRECEEYMYSRNNKS